MRLGTQSATIDQWLVPLLIWQYWCGSKLSQRFEVQGNHGQLLASHNIVL